MHPGHFSYRVWRGVALVSASLIVVWAAAAYIYDLSPSGADFIDEYFDYFNYIFIIALIGVLGFYVGSIGWAKHLDRSGRARMGWAVFAVPWALLLPGVLMQQINVHGSLMSLTFLIPLATVLAVVLWIMAARQPLKQNQDGDSELRSE
jgi:hypothetical protein